MRYLGRTAIGVIFLAATLGTATHSPAAAAADAFSALPGPGQARLPTLIGHDTGGTSIAVVLTGKGKAVGYACDGTGKVSVWLTGSFDTKTGNVVLSGADQTSLTYSLTKNDGKFTFRGSVTSFQLERARGIAGLYRRSETVGKDTGIAGWIVDLNSRVVGTATVGGKTVASVSESLTRPVSASVASPTTTIAITAFGFFKTIQCGVLDFRVGFNTGQALDAVASGDSAGVADATADNDVIQSKRTRAGCAA